MYSYNLTTREETVLCQENHPLYDIKIFNYESQTGELSVEFASFVASCYFKCISCSQL